LRYRFDATLEDTTVLDRVLRNGLSPIWALRQDIMAALFCGTKQHWRKAAGRFFKFGACKGQEHRQLTWACPLRPERAELILDTDCDFGNATGRPPSRRAGGVTSAETIKSR
jgi:hypothetical protein